MTSPTQLREALGTSAFAFRGYNVTNLGRTPELLEHAVYGPIVHEVLQQGSRVCTEVLERPVDLVERVRRRQETTSLDSYAEDAALVVCVSLAQLRLLERCFDISLRQAKLVFGYSLGEASALIATGLYALPDLLRVLLSLAGDAVALAEGVTMGVLFSRGPALDLDLLERLCLELSHAGKGVIGISSILSPNCVLLLGQEDTIARLENLRAERLPRSTYLRKNQHRWPPLHTPITWQRALPNRSAVLLQTLPGGFVAPTPPILSGVTGKASYNDYNSRVLLHRWVDHPQQLWEQIYQTLTQGIQTVIHVGPDPNLIPATYKRLADDIRGQLAGRSPGSLGLRMVSQVARRPWLAQLLPSRAALLRAPFLEHVILEDWLLAQNVDGGK